MLRWKAADHFGYQKRRIERFEAQRLNLGGF